MHLFICRQIYLFFGLAFLWLFIHGGNIGTRNGPRIEAKLYASATAPYSNTISVFDIIQWRLRANAKQQNSLMQPKTVCCMRLHLLL